MQQANLTEIKLKLPQNIVDELAHKEWKEKYQELKNCMTP